MDLRWFSGWSKAAIASGADRPEAELLVDLLSTLGPVLDNPVRADTNAAEVTS